ncbi:MAG: 16S rRNA (uracil(1498)-N(3))-methyltransferase [Paludibacteraceae bacterium]|nr:16S rRNA (uracil(1498)-N(3))-methyltransferase [Paludibacteraceae bacterium]
MFQFYAPNILTDNTLPEEESHHAVKVLRLQAGDSVLVMDGQGTMYHATIAVAHPKHCVLNSLEKVDAPRTRNYHLHIAIAPTKNMDRLEWFVEKAAEIGIDEISPIFCTFSERKVLKTDRIEKILVSAMKQSMQPYLTKLNEPCSFKEFLKRSNSFDGQKFIGHCHSGNKEMLAKAAKPDGKYLIMIGPEGDFSEEEVSEAVKNGFTPISLGSMRLRVETAALYSCSVVAVKNQLS